MFGRPAADGAWEQAEGGAIGTIAAMDQYAASCAWTWLRFIAGSPTVAAFYCTIEDPRIARIELATREGLTLQADTTGRGAVVLPYTWDMHAGWPAQQPGAIRLFDQSGQPLALPTSPAAP